MQIKINGNTETIRDGISVEQLLGELGIDNRNLAIEFNGDFIEGAQLAETTLNEGDWLEIVRFVGGG